MKKQTKTKAACVKANCPFAEKSDERCVQCPGPGYFASNHDCHRCFLGGAPDERCRICKGPSDEPSHKGMSVVSIDAMAAGDGDGLLRARIDTKTSHSFLSLTPGEEEVARRVSSFYLALEADEFDLVKHLVNGGNLNIYASIHNTTRQRVWNMAMKMMKRSPEIRAIVKERKQLNGRILRPKGSDARQMTLS